jgi:hypothetical protein
MSAVVWIQEKIKTRVSGRKRTIKAFVSTSSPGIALQEGEWIDMSEAEGKEQLDTYGGYRPLAMATGAICGPVFTDFDKASEYAVAVAALTDWDAQGVTLPGPLYAKLMRLWYPAAGKTFTPKALEELARLEATEPTP